MSSKYTIKQILADHWGSFLLENPNVRPVVRTEVQKAIHCGDPDFGCSLYVCPDCGAYKFVPFRCHCRFCNTCGTAYQADRADAISFKLINCRHRHVVFTIAEELRPYFRKDRRLLHVLFRSAAQVFSDWFYSQNHKEDFRPGMVTALHTFGRDLKWNPHIHMLITEGAAGKITEWKKFRHFPYTMLRKKWMTALLANMKASLDPGVFSLPQFNALVSSLYRKYPDGFYVNAPSKDEFNSPMAVAEYITRYIGRPVMAQSRITAYDGTHVTYWYRRHEDNQTVSLTEHAHDFIKKLIIHIPEKGFNMLRYYGLYAMPDKASEKLVHLMKRHLRSSIRVMQRWVFRTELSFRHDPLKCPCGGYMEFKDIYIPNPDAHAPPSVLKYAHYSC
ncbi:IS91 family transposase [Hominibacterium faecale]|uniref:IS91 family transposase n=1 Tax=Hominibacterium faecale TaxID=2839743 RepID=UPI0039E8F210